MSRYFVTRDAEADIDEILAFIAADDFEASISFYSRLSIQFRSLAENPKMGRERSDISEGVRCFPMGNYLIFYRVWAREVAITRVIHGARDLDDMFS